jgi:predicted nucleic-acid-binding protein
MSKNLVDANILLRLLLQDQPELAKKAQTLLESSQADSLVVTAVILAEVVYVLRGLKYERLASVTALAELMAYEPFSYDEPNVAACLDLYSTTNIDFADCYLITRNLKSGEGIESYDQALIKKLDQLRVR